MELTSAGLSFADVTEQQLDEAFADDARRGEFVILTAEDGSFLQAGGESEGPYRLEYRDAGSGKQFQATREAGKEEVKQAFLDYLRGGSAWRAQREWREMTELSRKGCARRSAAAYLFVIAGALATLGLWLART